MLETEGSASLVEEKSQTARKKIIRKADVNCLYCGGTGVRGSKPYAWYMGKEHVITTLWDCGCVREEEYASEDQTGDA